MENIFLKAWMRDKDCIWTLVMAKVNKGGTQGSGRTVQVWVKNKSKCEGVER